MYCATWLTSLPQAAIGHALVQNHHIGVIVLVAEQADNVLVPELAEEAHFAALRRVITWIDLRNKVVVGVRRKQ